MMVSINHQLKAGHKNETELCSFGRVFPGRPFEGPVLLSSGISAKGSANYRMNPRFHLPRSLSQPVGWSGDFLCSPIKSPEKFILATTSLPAFYPNVLSLPLS